MRAGLSNRSIMSLVRLRGPLPSALGLLLAAGCTGAVEVTPAALEGTWGAPHVEVTFDDTGRGAVQYDCAHGTLDAPLVPGAAGAFTATGEHVLEHGGPVREGEVPDAHPARYEGQLRGDRLRLTVRLLDDGTVLGPFDLRRGRPGELFRCL